MKNNNCFYCKNHDRDKGVIAENTGWYHPCIKGNENEGLKEIKSCKDYIPCNGFQIGGYYSHMYFEAEEENGCMEWIIESDGEFPTQDKNRIISLHICDFRQIEECIKLWGKWLREKGYINDEKA